MTIDLGISFENYSNVNKEIVKKPIWSKVSIEEILEFSRRNIDWNYSSEYLNVEDMWQELHGKLNSITSRAPKSTFDSSNRPLKLPWSTSRLKRMLRNKDKAWDTFDINSTKENLYYALTKQGIYDNEEFRLNYNYEKKLTLVI